MKWELVIHHSLVTAVVAASAVCLGTSGVGETASESNVKLPPFKMYEAMLYRDQPDLRGCGLERVDILYEHRMGIDWSDSGGTLRADFEEVVARHRDSGRQWIVLDIERFSRSEAPHLAWALQNYREALPDKKIGFYGFFPPYFYWDVILDRSMYAFTDEESRDAYFALAANVDAFFPSLYTHYDRPAEWESFAKGIVGHSRHLTERVMPFLWPQYHPGSDKTIGLEFISPAVWRGQLELMHELADGVVIWGGWRDREGERLVWDAAAPWWQETLSFMRNAGIGAPDDPLCPR